MSIKKLVRLLEEQVDPDTYLAELEEVYGLLKTVSDMYAEPDAKPCLEKIVTIISGEGTDKDAQDLLAALEKIADEYEDMGLEDVAEKIDDVCDVLDQACELDDIAVDGTV